LRGVGPGNFSYFYQHYKPAEALESVADPHNFLLSILTQYGPLGLIGLLAMLLAPLWRLSSIQYPVSSIQNDERRVPAITFLLVISSALLLIRPMIISAAPADTLEGIIYVIFALYVTPVAVFFIGFLLLTAPLQTIRNTQYAIRNTQIIAVLFCAVLGVLLHNLIDFAIFEPGVFTSFWAIMACLIAEDRSQTTEDRKQRTADSVQRTAYSGQRTDLYAKRCTLNAVFWISAGVLILMVFVRYAWLPVYKSTTTIKQAYRAFSMGQIPQAHHFFAAAAEYDLLDPAALNLDGRLYVQHYTETGQKQPALLKNAEQCFLQAIERNKADYKNYEKLSAVYELLGRSQKAYNFCEKAAQLYPGSGQLQFKLAQLADKLGKTDPMYIEIAIEQYKIAIEIEDKYRRQFQMMYPERKEIVSRLGEEKYQFAKKRLTEILP
jgi:tetratricopeptide (TPR) repeat protein